MKFSEIARNLGRASVYVDVWDEPAFEGRRTV